MADIRIHRKHQLGLTKARAVAWQWAEDVEKKFDMECTVIEGDTSDTVEFTRAGVNDRRRSVRHGRRQRSVRPVYHPPSNLPCPCHPFWW